MSLLSINLKWISIDFLWVKGEYYCIYNSQYNLHMYGWFILKSAFTGREGDGFFSDLAYRAQEALVLQDLEDSDPWIAFATKIVGLLGL